ncbi:MAG: metallophosphoesterase [Oligoflexia bacterium]|nr:metallophosphoesterase [Oligoflexia bacterium]
MNAKFKKIIYLLNLIILNFIYQNIYINLQAVECKNYTVMGDIHGNLSGLVDNFTDAGFINENCELMAKKTSAGKCIVLMGDIVDRGDASIESYLMIREMRQEMRKRDQDIIQLLGNHELLILQGNMGDSCKNGGIWFISKERRKELGENFQNKQACNKPEFSNEEKEKYNFFKKLIQEDIKNGNITAAAVIKVNDKSKKDIVLTHAGITEKVAKKFAACDATKANELVLALNNELKSAIEKKEDKQKKSKKSKKNKKNMWGKYDDDSNPFGREGIFWTRRNKTLNEDEQQFVSRVCKEFNQIRGHVIHKEITSLEDKSLLTSFISVDTALYYNRKSFLRIEPSNKEIFNPSKVKLVETKTLTKCQSVWKKRQKQSTSSYKCGIIELPKDEIIEKTILMVEEIMTGLI